jgi:aryl-alcohol dehydrogenase-like predicted oxidoreductase
VAAEFCRSQGTTISKLAIQFASQNPEIPTTLFSSSNPASVRSNVECHEDPYDASLLAEVRKILTPVMNKEWSY